MYTEHQIKEFISNDLARFRKIAAISTIKSGQGIRDKEMIRLVASMETCLIILGILKLGEPLPYKKTKHKFLLWEWESQEHYWALILRLVEEYLGIVTSSIKDKNFYY